MALQAKPADLTTQYCEEHIRSTGIAGMSIAVMRDGKVLYAQGFGFKNHAKTAKATPQTVYRLGSVAKPVTAVAAMQQVEAGMLNLDADVRKYVPSFPKQDATITLRSILCHQSGIRHYIISKRDVYYEPFPTALSAVKVFANDPVLFKPGEKFSYSTHAFTLVAASVEQATGMPMAEVITKNIATKAGARSLRAEDRSKRDSHRSDLFELKNGVAADAGQPEDISWKLGGGGMESNVVDLAKFADSLIAGKLMKPETLGQMWTRQKLGTGLGSYGLGWVVREYSVVEHGGAQQGCRAFLTIDLPSRTVVAYLSNTGGHSPAQISEKVRELWSAH